MKILFVVDIHWNGRRELVLPPVEGFDVVLLGGDLVNFLGKDPARRVVQHFLDGDARVMAVCGNCDLPEVEELFDELEIGLDRRAVEYQGIRFAGLSGGLPFGDCPYERTEDEYAGLAAETFQRAAELDASSPLVLLSHQPPRDTACDLARGQHVGSTALRAAIEAHQPTLVLSGHIHEGIGTDTIGETTVVNPGPWFQGRSAVIEISADADTEITLRKAGA